MTFLYLNKDTMGDGDPALGKKLLRIFLKKLADSDIQIDMIGCVNAGIALTTEPGDALESLKRLEAKGARIATCGTCLDHYGQRDQLLIGEVGSMDQAVQIMGQADKIICP